MSREGDFGAERGLGRVSIVGAGQVGTMLGMALMGSARGGVAEVSLFDRERSVAEASLGRGSAHRILDRMDEAVMADTLVLAVPVQAILGFLEEWGDRLRPGSFVIDTGSAKVVVVDAMRGSVPATVHSLGGHPMAGTEVPGPHGVAAELCRGAPFALVPVRDDPEALARGRDLVAAVGAIPVEMDAETHDRTVARTSHLPHLLAYALAAVARDASEPGKAAPILSSTGLAGATRLASSDPHMVAGFLCANASHVRRSVAELTDDLSELLGAMDHGPDHLARVLARMGASPEGIP